MSASPFFTPRLSEAERRDERARIASGEAPIVVGARSAVFAPVPRLGDHLHRRGTRRVVQAGVGSALRRAHGRRETCRSRRRRRGVRQRDAASRELGDARAARPRRAPRRPTAAGARRRPAPRGRLPVVGAAACRARSDRGARRQGDPAAQPPRRRARAALPCVRADVALRQLRRRARAARRRPAALPSLRAHGAGAGNVCRLRLDGDRATRRGNAEARARARGEAAGAGTHQARRRCSREARRARGRAEAFRRGRPCRPRRHTDGRQGPPLLRRRARRCRGRGHRARHAGLPRRGAHLPAADTTRRAQRPRRARARARADIPARLARDRARRAA